MNKKKFKTIEEQKTHLIQNKNILNSDKITSILNERTYVSIINPYKEFFYTDIDSNRTHIYDSKTNFDDYIKIASLDDSIANKLHFSIGYFERKLKQVIAYQYSKYFATTKGDISCTSYVRNVSDLLKICLLEDSTNTRNSVNTLMNELGLIDINKKYYAKGALGDINDDELEKIILYRYELFKNLNYYSTSKNNNITRHYIDSQEFLPFWLVVHQLSFGDLLGLCSMFNNDLRAEIHKHFDNSKESFRRKETHQFFLKLDTLRHIRNTVNHYEPILIKFKTFSLVKLESALKILKSNFDNSIIAQNNNHDLSGITETKFNNTSLNLISLLQRLV